MLTADLGGGWTRYDIGVQALPVENKYFNDTRMDFRAVWRVPWSSEPGRFAVYSPYPTSTVHMLIYKDADVKKSRTYFYLDVPGLNPWSPGDDYRLTVPFGATPPPGAGDGTWIGNNWPWVALGIGGAGVGYYLLTKGRR